MLAINLRLCVHVYPINIRWFWKKKNISWLLKYIFGWIFLSKYNAWIHFYFLYNSFSFHYHFRCCLSFNCPLLLLNSSHFLPVLCCIIMETLFAFLLNSPAAFRLFSEYFSRHRIFHLPSKFPQSKPVFCLATFNSL